MKTLDLEELWQIMGKLSWRQEELSEEGKYVYLLGNRSEYYHSDFEHFLNYYSFKIENDEVVVFNNDPIPYESWDNDDVSYIPLSLLSLAENKLEKWIDKRVEEELEGLEAQKIAEKERIKQQIKMLEKQLNRL